MAANSDAAARRAAPRTSPRPPDARRSSTATPLAALYAALIVYASLYPFDGWRWPGSALLGFLSRPWPRWWTAFDIAANAVGYVPLGLLVFVAVLRSGRGAAAAWSAATALAAALSFALELLQNFLPQRVPSNVDFALNAAGGAIGASLGALVAARGGIARWQALRDRWFAGRSAAGIALLVAWPVGLLFPLPLPLGMGQVLVRARDALDDWLQDTPAAEWAERWLDLGDPAGLGPGGEWLVVALGMLAPCLVGYSIVVGCRHRMAVVAAAGVAGVAATALSTALNFGPQHAFAWATPPAVAAVAAGLAVALAMVALPRRAAAAVGLMVLTALVVLVSQAPTDPYFAQTLQAWEQGRFIRFHGAAQWVGWLWPYAAIAHLLAAVTLRAK